ncbi:histidine kinase [Streptomyces sp. NPDC089919]|uniref:sensor histidine kinase n=1 Tax=Streptomyces sp. NPDC089919 TaxID=3155188 RepID=UPI00343ADA87
MASPSVRPLVRPLAEAAAGALVFAVTYTVLRGSGAGTVLPHRLKALCLLAALALFVVRRRFPALSLLGMGALLGPLSSLGMLAAATAYTTARRLPGVRRTAALLLAAGALCVCTAALAAPRQGIGSLQYGLTIGGVVAGISVLVPGLAGTSAGQQDRLLAALRERTASAEEASRSQERTRIAAEMHDLVGHRLSLISLHAGGLEMALRGQPPELRESAGQVRQATRDAMRELREVLGVLGPLSRDTGTDALTDATGTRADVTALVEESRGGGIAVSLEWTGPDTDIRRAGVRRALHRVVREGLTNVHRYAPGSVVAVTVSHTDDLLVVRVVNGPRPELSPADRPGPAPAGTGRGLSGLRERVALLGGTLESGPRPGGGFGLTARIPAEPEQPAGSATTGGAAPAAVRHAPGEPWGLRGPALLRPLLQTASALLGMAGLGAMLVLGLRLADDLRLGDSYAPPEPPRVGMTRSQAERAGPIDYDLARAAAAGHEPRRPPGATECVFPYGFDRVGTDSVRLTRYCFTGDILTSIDRFDVPLAPRGDHRSTP